ncbi:TPA: phage antirepressor N-terminal domain-containing protein [Klebsiella pneumoniae]|nr:phage antirepressor N-terminal domain-containing protein [Akkermansia muciniphila]HDK6466404.1 phage antirepressor N-terminal domain-containing protein [Klebsiella variicola]
MTSLAIADRTINVPFYGNSLFVVEHNGEPYTPMKPIIDGMGMDWASQFTKLKQRFKTSIVKITMQLPGDNQRRDIICLALRKLAGWLQTISANKVRPEIREKVIQYQEECDDVLYEYWTKGEVKNPRKKTTVDERTPLRDAVNMLVSKRHMMYPEAYAMIHQRFNVDSIEDLEPSQIPTAIEYVHRVALEGEFLGKQETLPAPKFDVNIPLQWWIDNNPLVRIGNLSFGKSLTAPSFDVTMEMLCGDNSTSAAIRLINVLEEAGFDVSAPKAEIVAMRKHLGNVEYGMKAIADACRRAGNKTISFRGGKAEYVIG